MNGGIQFASDEPLEGQQVIIQADVSSAAKPEVIIRGIFQDENSIC